MPSERFELPGSKCCVGCGGQTFRNRDDGLCPRCAYQAEQLIEQIELDCLANDLDLMCQFDAYCRDRDQRIAQAADLARAAVPVAEFVPAPFTDRRPLFEAHRCSLPGMDLPPIPDLRRSA